MSQQIVRKKSKLFKLGEQDSGIRTRVKVQDFQQLRDECKHKACLFEDPEFPAQDSSVFFSKRPKEPFEWKRPRELTVNPQLFVAGATRFDINQGSLGDCWLLAALANLTLQEDLLNFVVPHDQGFDDTYAGIFHFRFWQYGRWVDVVVDDRLPTVNGDLVFLRSTQRNEFWSALLEKAYAKLHGSYESLEGGTTSEAMVDFTGGVSEIFSLENVQPSLYKILLEAYQHKSLLSCSIMPDPNIVEAQTYHGLVKGHAYSITKVNYFHVKTPKKEGLIPLIRLRNPWGNDIEWTGPWSDKSKEWRLVSSTEKTQEGLNFDNDGEFWMAFKDFLENFSYIEICSVSIDAMIEEISVKDGEHMWKMSMFEGEWVRNVSAGGCANDLESFSKNPQYRVTLRTIEGEKDNKCTVIIALMQKNRRKQRQMGKQSLTIGFEIYYLEDPEKLPKPLDVNFFENHTHLASTYIDLREISKRFRLKPGTYCIVPTTFEAGEEGEFIIRVFTETTHNMTEYDMEVGLNEKSVKVQKLPSQEVNHAKEFFCEVAGEDMEVSWEELKKVLNFTIKPDSIKEEFSTEVCRSMIAMMDKDRSGKLSFEEFEVLWAAIVHWKEVFHLFEKNSAGYIYAANLKKALSSAGYQLNCRILNALAHRYGNKEGNISFNDFIMCALRLKTMIDTFRKQEVGNSNVATFSIDQWIERTVYT